MDTAQFVSLLTNVLMLVFLWSMNLGQGMSFTLQQIATPFKKPGVILLAVLLNSVLIPLLYWALTLVLPMNPDYATGFMLVGFAAAAPFAIKAAAVEKGDMPLMIGLVVLLGALNVVFIPLWCALLMPAGTTVDVLNIAVTLVVLVLAPLALGLLIRARWAEHAREWAPEANKISTLMLLLVIALMFVTSWQSIVSILGAWVIVGGLIAIAISMVAGYFFGGKNPAARRTVATVSGMRAVGPALAIAASAFAGNPDVTAVVVVLGILSFVPFAVAIEWGKRLGGTEATASAAPAAVPATTKARAGKQAK
jgi:predicted Na+-dependent transporter